MKSIHAKYLLVLVAFGVLSVLGTWLLVPVMPELTTTYAVVGSTVALAGISLAMDMWLSNASPSYDALCVDPVTKGKDHRIFARHVGTILSCAAIGYWAPALLLPFVAINLVMFGPIWALFATIDREADWFFREVAPVTALVNRKIQRDLIG